MRRDRETILDELLVLRSQAGHRESFELLVRRWHPRLLRQAQALTGSVEAAQEISQEAWVGVVRRLGRLEDPARFPAWIRRILSRRAADWIRQRQRGRRLAERLVRQPQPELDPPAAEVREALHAARRQRELLRDELQELSLEQRAVVELHYLRGWTVDRIADALSIPAGTVKSRLHHARRRLRQAMEVP